MDPLKLKMMQEEISRITEEEIDDTVTPIEMLAITFALAEILPYLQPLPFSTRTRICRILSRYYATAEGMSK